MTRPGTAADRDRVGTLLASAFADEEAMVYLFPDPSVRAAQTPKLFRLLFDTDRAAGQTWITAGGEAATLWRRPGHADLSFLELMRSGLTFLSTFGLAVQRALRLADALEAQHPARDFWYLHIAGCDRAHQGRGFGRRAIQAGIAHAGEVPCLLETATERNVPFYASLGFGVSAELVVPGGGPKFWQMIREP